jgi:hypothetical protein
MAMLSRKEIVGRSPSSSPAIIAQRNGLFARRVALYHNPFALPNAIALDRRKW